MNSRADLYQNVFDSFPSGLLVLELDDTDDPTSCRQIRVNDAACQVTGMEMKANKGKLWRDTYPELAETGLPVMILDTFSKGEIKE